MSHSSAPHSDGLCLNGANCSLNGSPRISFSHLEVKPRLQVKPKFRRHSKIVSKSQGCIWRDGPFSMHNLIHPGKRHVDISRQFVLADVHGFHEFFQENLSGKNGLKLFDRFSPFFLVVIHNFDIPCVSISPLEANPPLFIYSDAVLTSAIPLKRLQSVSGRYP